MTNSRMVVLLLVVAMVAVEARMAWALAGEVKSPSVACPVDSEGRSDAIVSQLNSQLEKTKDQFASGSFVNATTILKFNGATADLNQMLASLAGVDGLKITLRITGQSKRNLIQDKQSPSNEFVASALGPIDSAWVIQHSAWSDPHHVTCIVNLDAETMDRIELEIPEIRGVSKPDVSLEAK